ncbi:carboxylic ester hydrolase-like [Onthophagus taurus]|uniref:carboxylic ester hydrolase-like n=1 Tax=Onthophagus taurus TaxID=166361 RepID=UPI0039BE174C
MFYFVLFALIFASTGAEKDLILQLEDGLVEGFYKTSYNGRKYASFEGIPFATPPIQKYRFRSPQPAQKWNGTLPANQVYTCIQLAGDKVFGTEDCLYINVYVPKEKINREDKLDVIVHIHGGAFMMGSGHSFAGPSKIMDRDVILVNFNYRLGPFGFLATEDDVFHGNYGMKDQIQALRWVQANIEHFGGNKDSVTIIGLSAGGASVHLHYFNWDTEEVLFHKGWAQSGAALNPWAVRMSSWPNAKKLINDVGCKDENIKVTLRCMRQRTAIQIAESVKGIYLKPLLPLAPFAPNSELMSTNNQDPFLITPPYVQLKSGHVLDRPFIISQTTDEGMLPAAMYYNNLDEIDRDWNKLAPYMLEFYHAPEEDWVEISEKIKDFYFKGENITKSNFKSFLKVCNQRLFHMGAEKSAKMQANISNSDVYFLMFGYPGADNPMKTLYNAEVEGVGHGYDAKFFYDFEMLMGARLTPEEEKMKDIMLDFLVSFAKTGKPTSNGVEWNPVAKEGNLKYLFIKNPEDIQMKSTKRLGAYEFWKSLGIKEEENLYHFTAAGIEIK